MSSPSSPSKPVWNWWKIAALVAIVLGVPTLIGLAPPPRRPFDDKALKLLQKNKPTCVLLGDSMLGTRIEEKVLSQLASERCFVLSQPGSSSATWYLMMKNLVTAQTPPPRTVIILYRNRQLTLPAHRAEGEYRKSMEPYMQGPEPLIDRLVIPSQKPPGLLEGAVNAIYPLERQRENVVDKMQSWALDLVASSREYDRIRDSAKILFSPKNLRTGTLVDEQEDGGQLSLDPDTHDFEQSVGASFLPVILEIARSHNIQLVFYEVKRRPRPDGGYGEESVTAPAYRVALRAYLEKAGARLFDETREGDVTLDLYGSGDHISSANMPRYTEIFWRKVGPLVRPAP